MNWIKGNLIMKRIPAYSIILILLLPALLFAKATWTGKVVGISDGDTITVLRDRTQIKIRLHGVDCPEKKQAFGTRARQFTADMVFGKTVTIRPATTDRYGRTVAWVIVDGKNLNEELVRAGMAWHYRRY